MSLAIEQNRLILC